MSGHVSLRHDGALAIVTLDHPGRMNAISRDMWRELASVFTDVAADNRVHAVCLQGAGSHFAAGADIEEFPAFRFDPATLRAYHEDLVAPALRAIIHCDAPVLARIDGVCVGGGLEIAACCDLRISARRARFGLPIARLGFPVAPAEMALLVQQFGRPAVVQLLWQARVLGAEEALRIGLVHEVVPDAALDEHVRSMWRHWQTLSPQALRLNKQTLRALDQQGLNPAQHTAQPVHGVHDTHYDYAASHDHREGIAAFLDKRPARFLGC